MFFFTKHNYFGYNLSRAISVRKAGLDMPGEDQGYFIEFLFSEICIDEEVHKVYEVSCYDTAEERDVDWERLREMLNK